MAGFGSSRDAGGLVWLGVVGARAGGRPGGGGLAGWVWVARRGGGGAGWCCGGGCSVGSRRVTRRGSARGLGRACPVGPVVGGTAGMVLMTPSWVVRGRPRQLRVIWQNSRCSILFHLEVPGGKC